MDESIFNQIIESFSENKKIKFLEKFYCNGKMHFQIECYEYYMLQRILEEVGVYIQLRVRFE